MIDLDKPLSQVMGAPYAFPPDPPRSFDCWTLLVHVRALLGLDTPVNVDVSAFDRDSMREAVEAVLSGGRWRRNTAAPQVGDALLFTPSHIGVVVQGGVVHAHSSSMSVLFTKWPVVRRRWPGHEVYTT